MKFIVLGGAGFIGSHLAEDLSKKKENKVIIIDNLSTGRIENIKNFRSKIKFIKDDISKKGKWQNAFKKVDYVFHLAALADIVPSIDNPETYYQSNVTGTLNVLEACKKFNIKKLIYAASSSCYGIPKDYPTKETAKISPIFPYAVTKYLGEELIIYWSKIYKMNFISLRLFNVYGPRSRTSGTYGAMFGVFLAQKLANKPYTLVGNGSQSRDFTYVSDVVNAFIRASKSKVTNKIFNVGSNKTVSVKKIIEYLGGPWVNIPKRPGEPDITYANISQIKKYLKWSPKVDIQTGINIMLKNINYWKNAPIWNPQSINKATKNWFKYLEK
jgi:UDP-glucose 4-epimerase